MLVRLCWRCGWLGGWLSGCVGGVGGWVVGCPAVLEVWVGGWLSVGGSDLRQSWSCVFVGFTDVYVASPFLIVAGL